MSCGHPLLVPLLPKPKQHQSSHEQSPCLPPGVVAIAGRGAPVALPGVAGGVYCACPAAPACGRAGRCPLLFTSSPNCCSPATDWAEPSSGLQAQAGWQAGGYQPGRAAGMQASRELGGANIL
jgi:hypothetical protein